MLKSNWYVQDDTNQSTLMVKGKQEGADKNDLLANLVNQWVGKYLEDT